MDTATLRPGSPAEQQGPRVLGLSALSAEALQAARLRLADRLTAAPAPALDDVAATLARGRERFPFRCAVVGDDPAVLARLLREGAATGAAEATGAVRTGVAVPSGATPPEPAPEEQDPFARALRVAELWCLGQETDLTLGRPGHRVRLPGYPFRRGTAAVTPPATGGDPDTRPLTPLEQRRLFHDLVRSGSSGEHNLTAVGQLQGPLDPVALQQAFDALQLGQPLLRTVFEEYGGRWRARLLPGPTIRITLLDPAAPAAPGDLDAAGSVGFDLAGRPLVRCTASRGPIAAVALTLYEPMAAAIPVDTLLDLMVSDYQELTSRQISARSVPVLA